MACACLCLAVLSSVHDKVSSDKKIKPVNEASGSMNEDEGTVPQRDYSVGFG